MTSHHHHHHWSDSLLRRFGSTNTSNSNVGDSMMMSSNTTTAAFTSSTAVGTTSANNNSNGNNISNIIQGVLSSPKTSMNVVIENNSNNNNNNCSSTVTTEKQSLLLLPNLHNTTTIDDCNITIYDTQKDRSSIYKQILRSIRKRYQRLSIHTKRCILFGILPVITFIILVELIDTIFPRYGPIQVQQPQQEVSTTAASAAAKVFIENPIASNKNEYVVVINTYQRPKQLHSAVRHYAEICGPKYGISNVYIIWAEENVIPPTSSTFFPISSSTTTTPYRTRRIPLRSTITVLPVRNSLNSRFLPIDGVHDNAVFMVDDDIRVDCTSLQRGYNVWKLYPNSMVGYYPRLSSTYRSVTDNTPTEFIYLSWPSVFYRQKYNFILTKAAFIHSNYMSIYSDPNQHPIEILQYIDQYFNCEDVAMSLLVANYTTTTTTTSNDNTFQSIGIPIYVEGTIQDKGLFNGISTGSGHMEQRSKCLTDLSYIYQKYGYNEPLKNKKYTLSKVSWRKHYFWWQYRPSNIFEWFALSNIFK